MHPLIVHFPIACLVLYTWVEVVTFLWPRSKTSLLTTKYFLLGIGVIGSFGALYSGEIAMESSGMQASRLVQAHESFAQRSHLLYMIISLWYIAQWIIQKKICITYWPKQAQSHLSWFIRLVDSKINHIIIALLAIAGFLLISITGALGAAITHGPDVDMIVRWVYDLVM